MAQRCQYQELDVPPKLMMKKKKNKKDEKKKLVREAAKRPAATLKELRELLAAPHVPTFSRILHMSGLWQDGSLFLRRKTSKPG